MPTSFDVLRKALEGSDQDHVLQFWGELNEKEREHLAKQITDISNVAHLNSVLRASLALLDGHSTATVIEPPPVSSIFDSKRTENAARVQEYQGLGLEAVSQSRVAVLLMAGGSGTRLGVPTPKGMFSCPLLKQQKSLFQFHSEKIRRVERLAKESFPAAGNGGLIPFIIMTSEQNNEETIGFFKANSFFGLKEAQVHFFIQSSLPCYDEKTGKILMESKSAMCVAPGGNGGVYQSFAASSILSTMKAQGVQFVQIFGVDNLLAAVADPVFFGYAIKEKKQVAVKTTPKSFPQERVGVFALLNGKWGVVEYTEIGDQRASERDAQTGELKFNCANIVTHVCSVEFLEYAAQRMEKETSFHAARKEIPTINGKKPAVKLEAFIFDMFAYCNDVKPGEGEAFGIMQVDRTEEFAPIKNADTASSDTPKTAALQLQQLHRQWAQKALSIGSAAATEARQRLEKGDVAVEISPLVSYQGEDLETYKDTLVKKIGAAKAGDVVLIEEEEGTKKPGQTKSHC